MRNFFLLSFNLLFLSAFANDFVLIEKLHHFKKALEVFSQFNSFVENKKCAFVAPETPCYRSLSESEQSQFQSNLEALVDWKNVFLDESSKAFELPFKDRLVLENGEKFSQEIKRRFNPLIFRQEEFLYVTLNIQDQQSQEFLKDLFTLMSLRLLIYDQLIILGQSMTHYPRFKTTLGDNFDYLKIFYRWSSDKSNFNKLISVLWNYDKLNLIWSKELSFILSRDVNNFLSKSYTTNQLRFNYSQFSKWLKRFLKQFT
jgi:hypothetical protein